MSNSTTNNAQQMAELKKFAEAQIEELQASPEGVTGTLLEHWHEIRDAVNAGDYWMVATALNRLLSHLLGDEGMRSSEEMKAIPWLTLLPLFLQILQTFFNR